MSEDVLDSRPNLDVRKCEDEKNTGNEGENDDDEGSDEEVRVVRVTRSKKRIRAEAKNRFEVGESPENTRGGECVEITDDNTNTDDTDQRSWSRLYISASDVAAVCGYNPWTSLSELLLKYLYQSHHEELESDAKSLNLVVETTDEIVERLVRRTDSSNRQKLQKVLEDAASATESASVAQVENQKKRVEDTLAAVSESGVLKADDVEQLRELLRYQVCTQFGTRHENGALVQYTRQFGWDVTTPDTLFRIQLGAYKAELFCSHSAGKDESDKAVAEFEAEKKQIDGNGGGERELWVCGRVDGIAHIAVDIGEELESYVTEPVVLEVKSRTRPRSIERDPGFHEIIQLVVYMKMLGTTRGQLIQAFQQNPESPPSLQVHPVSFDEMHSIGWQEEIVPKLSHFAHVLLNARESREFRLNLLAKSKTQQEKWLQSQCSWFSRAEEPS